MPLSEVAAFLRGLAPEALLAAYQDGGMEGMIDVPQMFPDGIVLPAGDPIDVLAAGDYHQVPVILGSNRDENRLFMAFDPEFSRWRFFGLVPVPHDWDRYEAHADGLARAWKARAVDTPARAMRAVQGPSVYAYRWDWDEEPRVPLLFDGGRSIGAGHGLEIAFVFGHWDLGPRSRTLFTGGNEAGRVALSDAMMSYWAQFAATGSPGRGRAGDLPEWRAWDDGSPGRPALRGAGYAGRRRHPDGLGRTRHAAGDRRGHRRPALPRAPRPVRVDPPADPLGGHRGRRLPGRGCGRLRGLRLRRLSVDGRGSG